MRWALGCFGLAPLALDRYECWNIAREGDVSPVKAAGFLREKLERLSVSGVCLPAYRVFTPEGLFQGTHRQEGLFNHRFDDSSGKEESPAEELILFFQHSRSAFSTEFLRLGQFGDSEDIEEKGG